ncbi:MAG: DUF5011 domain-containing protein [Bacilli bacterium]|nr:DUF5011 domain-containing protein [Bacilli bacterium]
MKKGFTLIELIAVVTILGIIAIIAIPSVDKAIKDSKNRMYELQVSNIEDGAESWATDNVLLLPDEEGETITITLAQLKVGGYVTEDIKNPLTNELFSNDMEIVITRYSNSYIYELDTASGTEGNTELPTGPTIILNGSSIVYVEIGGTYTELGATGQNSDGSTNNDIDIVIKSNNTNVDNVETDRLGQYKIYYVIEEGDETATIIRTVIVRDTTPPELTIPDNVRITPSEVASFDLMEGVSATDNSGDSVTIMKSGNISIIPGTYTITYTAIDSKDNKTVKTRTVSVGAYTDTILNGSDPVLEDGMIPIIYDETNAVWVKADINDTWYDYEQQWWSNVVLVTEDSRSGYQSAASGTTINEADILAYLVWIPRYEYETITSDVATEIKINFISENKRTASSNYIIHPAFTFDGKNVAGIWVGKFETSTDVTSTCYTSPSTDNCLDVNPMIVPNVSSLRNQIVSTMFTTIQKMNSVTYGLTTGDAHMIKNTEWGAVAYLSQSIYGKYGNSMYTGDNKEIYQNKSASFITGSSNGTPGTSTTNTQCSYNDITNRGSGTGACGAGASTTGNIYGIYDMSGGAWDYVMGVMYNSDNTSLNVSLSGFISGTSGIDSVSFSKYVDKYNYGTTYNDSAAYARALTGDATTETKGWYSDIAYFVGSDSSSFVRGGYCSHNTSAGVFGFSRYNGSSDYRLSSRAVYVNP